ncbi:T9SS type A sorting domain-containing protein [bacterium]
MRSLIIASIILSSFQMLFADNNMISSQAVESDSNLQDAYAYPVPFRIDNADHKQVKFVQLAEKCEIKIFTISGELIKTIDHDAANSFIEKWDLKSEKGNVVTSGIYIYCIKSDTDVKTGKLLVLQ